MSPMPRVVPVAGVDFRYAVPTSADVYRLHLEEKQRRLNALCDAAKEYLGCELEAELAELSKPAPEPTYYPRPAFTAEALVKANSQCQNIEEQLAKLDEMAGSEFGKAMGPIIPRGCIARCSKANCDRRKSTARWSSARLRRPNEHDHQAYPVPGV